jgi:hypothetical protein
LTLRRKSDFLWAAIIYESAQTYAG